MEIAALAGGLVVVVAGGLVVEGAAVVADDARAVVVEADGVRRASVGDGEPDAGTGSASVVIVAGGCAPAGTAVTEVVVSSASGAMLRICLWPLPLQPAEATSTTTASVAAPLMPKRLRVLP